MSDPGVFSKLTVSELKELCTKRGLPITGKKQELIERLIESPQEDEQEDMEELLEGGEEEDMKTDDIKDEVENMSADDILDNEDGTEKTADVKDEVVEENGDAVKKESDENKTEQETKEEIPMIMKGKFHFYYNMFHSLKMVMINPMKPECFKASSLELWSKEAKEFKITKDDKGQCEGVLYFDTIDKGDNAFVDLKNEFETDPEVKVMHPGSSDIEHPVSSVSISAGQFWERLSDYSSIAKAPTNLKEAANDTLFCRHVVLEHVPESVTEAELVETFPEACCVLMFPFIDGCKGICMLEFPDENQCNYFLKEHQNKVAFGGQNVNISKYSNKLIKWERLQQKRPALKPCVLEDEERIELCKQVKEIEESKNKVLCRTDIKGYDKILEHVNLHDQMKPLLNKIKMDTIRRKKAKMSFPEPAEMKNNFTKFAETPNFEKKNKTNVFSRPNERKRKTTHTPGNRFQNAEPAYKRQNQMSPGFNRGGFIGARNYGNQRDMGNNYGFKNMGGGGRFVGSSYDRGSNNNYGNRNSGNFGGGNYGNNRETQGLLNVMQGLQTALSTMASQGFDNPRGNDNFGGGGNYGNRFSRGNMRRF